MTNGLTKTLFGSILSVVFIYLKKSYQTIQILSNSKKTVKDSFNNTSSCILIWNLYFSNARDLICRDVYMTLISTSFHWLISGTCVWWCEEFRRSTVKLLQVQCWVSSERIRKRGRNSFPSSGDERNLISNTIFLKICVLYIPMYAGLKRILLSHLDYIRVLVFCQGMVSLRPFLFIIELYYIRSLFINELFFQSI